MKKQIGIVQTPDTNTVFAKDQPEYNPLPCHRVKGDKHGRIIVTYELDIWQRLQVLIFGRLWLSVLTFGQPLQPLMMCSYNFIDDVYLPQDVVSVDVDGEQILSRLHIEQRVLFKGEPLFIAGFDKHDVIHLLTATGNKLTANKTDLSYLVDDLINNAIK